MKFCYNIRLTTFAALICFLSSLPAASPSTSALIPPLPEPTTENLRTARDALDNIFTLQGVRSEQPVDEEGDLIWQHRGPRNDKEWSWFLNRHLHFPLLLTAYKHTGDTAFLNKILTDLDSWITSQPSPKRLNFTESWRALEVARRIERSWIPVFFNLPDDAPPATEIRQLMLASIPAHADMLWKHPSFWGGNHYLTEKVTLARIATLWPQLPDAPLWLENAQQSVLKHLDNSVYPDGSYKEISNHYHWIALDNFSRMAELGKTSQINTNLTTRIENMWDYFIRSASPDGMGPLNKDADAEHNWHHYQRYRHLWSRPDWDFITSHGTSGRPPHGPPSTFFPYAGQLFLRSDWSADAFWLHFNLGPHGSAHQHDDFLHISLSLGTSPFLVDNGRYTYRPGPFRDYFRHATGHNTVLLNNQGARPPPRIAHQPIPSTVVIEENFAFAAARQSWPADPLKGKGPAHHSRSLLWIQQDTLLVLDWIQPSGPTKAEVRWHWHPNTEIQPLTDATIQVNHQNRWLRMQLLNPEAWQFKLVKGQDNPPLGWHSPQYNTKVPAPLWLAYSSLQKPALLAWLIQTDKSPTITQFSATLENDTVSISLQHGDKPLHWQIKDLSTPKPTIVPLQ